MKGKPSARVTRIERHRTPPRTTEDFGVRDPVLAEYLFREAKEAGGVKRLDHATPLLASRKHHYYGNLLANEGYLQTALRHYRVSLAIAEEEWKDKADGADLERYRALPRESEEFGARDPDLAKFLVRLAKQAAGVKKLDQGPPLLAARQHTNYAHVLANEGYFQTALQHYRMALAITEEEWSNKGKDVDIFDDNGYYGVMNNAAIRAAANLLSTVYPPEEVRRALEDLAARAALGTTERAKGETQTEAITGNALSPHTNQGVDDPSQLWAKKAAEEVPVRLKWEKDREPREDPAHFAVRAYGTEISHGTFDKSLIRRDDKTLYQRLFRDKAWDQLAALVASEVPTKSQRRAQQRNMAIQAFGIDAAGVHRVLTVVNRPPGARKSKGRGRAAEKLRAG